MTEDIETPTPGAPPRLGLATLLDGLGHELDHAAELLRRYERAVLAHKSLPGAAQGGARELQLVDLVIQLLEDLGPLTGRVAETIPPDAAVPCAVVEGLRLDQLRAVLGGATRREKPHSGGHIDVF
ncbi:hypothetical protein [Rhodovulum euryhalinum]|uniref:Uncharacterized protein n=1 Tax=Rhodovulum euryhalinum TaxID=35805 RepID=A0A4R2KBA3_9RHOB|nr:hypothetical protein [Rhodovulum euryhalinum]TCO70761.1 hypothetical protein EV655_1082 [Rhodovulum euryhalinum]